MREQNGSCRDVGGGTGVKARSMDVPNSVVGNRDPLPGELGHLLVSTPMADSNPLASSPVDIRNIRLIG
jgi:hypothetical protein